ncbi:MAG: hypothetical protein DWQ36_19880 [Acidobacteria bacterium]|nr:MAG: hypothetical protein DWQ36_19880 [Acidobacteriota bacterium]
MPSRLGSTACRESRRPALCGGPGSPRIRSAWDWMSRRRGWKTRAMGTGDLPDVEAVIELFEAVSELSPTQRAAHLDRVAPEPAIRREVESLLAALDRSDEGVLERRLDAQAALRLLAEEGPVSGGPIACAGPWRLLDELGRGGMGTVHLAERADGAYTQRAAVKLIKRGMDSDTIVGRFLRERQILAQLEHPNIARLLDGGVAEDGRPYFAMEYVEGVPITEFANAHRLGIDERLRLFAQVCEAVSHAHRALVVHRDLKASNTLVTPGGQVKLLDFGIAKLLADEDGAATELTRLGGRPLTVASAAPEQLRGEPITTATDVYALGVLLYRLLTGCSPFGEATDASSLAELEREILDTDPARPSRIVAAGGGDDAALPVDARSRQRWAKRLRGDLDSVVSKALAKEPRRRYRSVEALLDDLERHLAGLPVSAVPDGMLYRTGKLLSRHRYAATALAVVLALVVGFVWTLALQRSRIAQEAAESEQVKEFVLGLFELSDPDVSKGREITARELLGRGAERLDQEVDLQPEVRAEMLGVIGDVHLKLGLFDEASQLLERSLHLRRTGSPGSRELLESIRSLARARYEQADFEAAEALGREAVGLAERIEGEGPLLARSLDDLSVTLRARRSLEEAEQLVRRALDLRRAHLGEDHPEVATSELNLGVVLYLGERYEEAEALYRAALEKRLALQGELHLEVADVRNRLGIVLRLQDRYEEARTQYERVLSIYRRLLGDEHPLIATVLANLGFLEELRGDLVAARGHLERAVTMHRGTVGATHPELANSLENLARTLAELGEHQQATTAAREALQIRSESLGPMHPLTTRIMRNLGTFLVRAGELDEGFALQRRSIEIEREIGGSESVLHVLGSRGFGRDLLRAGRPAEAIPVLREALEIGERIQGGDSQLFVRMQVDLARALLDAGETQEAESVARSAFESSQRIFEPGDWRIADVENLWGTALVSVGERQVGLERLRRSLQELEQELGADSEPARLARQRLAAVTPP